MTTEYTPEVREKLKRYLATHTLPGTLGTEESACSIAAINLAMTGDLTDEIPACMSEVLGLATIRLQDIMPAEMRNSDRYKAWLVTAPDTGRDREQERLDVLLDWMWGTVLPQLQPVADGNGFGDKWRAMCEERTPDAAARAAVSAAARAARAASAVASAVEAVEAADAVEAVKAVCAAARAASAAFAADAVEAVACAARTASAADATYAAARADFWEAVDPIGVLERMTALEN